MLPRSSSKVCFVQISYFRKRKATSYCTIDKMNFPGVAGSGLMGAGNTAGMSDQEAAMVKAVSHH